MVSRFALAAVIVAGGGFFIWQGVRDHQHGAVARRLMPKITTFVERKYEPPRADGRAFLCELRYLGNSRVASRFHVYVWEVCQEYSRDFTGVWKSGEGWSVPAVISIERVRSIYRPVAEKEPGDGPDYAHDVRMWFPGDVQARIWSLDGNVGPLVDDLDQKAHRQLG